MYTGYPLKLYNIYLLTMLPNKIVLITRTYMVAIDGIRGLQIDGVGGGVI